MTISPSFIRLTASFDANMMALRKRTLKEGKFAWQLMSPEHVSATPAGCKADLAKFCKAGAHVQSEAMYYQTSMAAGAVSPAFTNCTVFGCTCKGAADYYGIDGSFGCAPKGAQDWWIHIQITILQ